MHAVSGTALDLVPVVAVLFALLATWLGTAALSARRHPRAVSIRSRGDAVLLRPRTAARDRRASSGG